jgi:hypothetical protein
MGFATRDPDFLHTTHGTPLCNLGMAINRKYKDDSGQEKQDTAFVDVTVWRRLAEIANEYVHKGDPVFIALADHVLHHRRMAVIDDAFMACFGSRTTIFPPIRPNPIIPSCIATFLMVWFFNRKALTV